MEDVLTPVLIVGIPFLGLPWLVLHYTTRWKTAPTLTQDDERMLGDLHDLARRLEDRLETVERLVASDNPDFRPDRAVERPRDGYTPLPELGSRRQFERNR